MSDNNPRPSGWLGPWCLLVGVILLVTGLFFAIGGFKLVSLGGSWYFLIAGVITLLSAIQFFRRKSSAVGLFALVFLGTLIWAFFDAGLDFCAAGFPFNGTRRADGAGSCHLACIA